MPFIDASIIVSIACEEPGSDVLIDRLEAEGGPFYYSALTRVDAALAFAWRMADAKGKGSPVTPDMIETGQEIVDQFLKDIGAKEISIMGDMGKKALEAAQRYGKIVNHEAQLSTSACLTYACAKGYRLKVAHRKDEFRKTDISW